MNSDQTCERCRYSTNEGWVCRRHPPVTLLSHSGAMRVMGARVMPESMMIVESALLSTTPYSTCGEWRPETVQPQLAEPSQELG